MPREVQGAQTLTTLGAEQRLGNTVFQINSTARTDTHAANGEVWIYRSGATLVLQVYDQTAGAWRSTTLS